MPDIDVKLVRHTIRSLPLAPLVEAIISDPILLRALDKRRARVTLETALPGVLLHRRAMSTRETAEILAERHPETWPTPGTVTALLAAYAREGCPFAERGEEEEKPDGTVFRRWLWMLPKA